ncbi:MAG: ParB/RepB/Spo0J family partition protein [Candidatus Limnocylindria bacterium]
MADSPARQGFGLGRGLEALIPPPAGAGDAQQIPLDRIVANPHQPRARFEGDDLDDLAASISAHGILQPVVVRGLANGDYQLIAGERRVRAARQAGLTQVPAVIRDPSEEEMIELALVENLQRTDLNPLEEAMGFRILIERFEMPHDAVASRVGRSRTAVTNALRLLDLAPETQEALMSGQISEGHARALAGLTVAELQIAALQIVLERQLSVRQTEELVRRRRRQARGGSSDQNRGDLQELENHLREILATRVAITRTRKGGRISIDFASDEELTRLFAWIIRTAPGSEAVEPIGIGSETGSR